MNPQAYLADVLTRLPTHPQAQLNELLPHRCQPRLKLKTPAIDRLPSTRTPQCATTTSSRISSTTYTRRSVGIALPPSTARRAVSRAAPARTSAPARGWAG